MCVLSCSALCQAPSNRNELDMVGSLQTGYVNFYEPSALMPYVPLVAKGPWVCFADALLWLCSSLTY